MSSSKGDASRATSQELPRRKRVTKACLNCAKSRRKCDGIQPTCKTCADQCISCAWSDVPTRRGPPKGYRRGAADPKSLQPKLDKIREHIQGLQVAYGHTLVMIELERTLFGSIIHGSHLEVGMSDVEEEDVPSEHDEGSSSGLAFLATSVRNIRTADPTSPKDLVLDSLPSPTGPICKNSPWSPWPVAEATSRQRYGKVRTVTYTDIPVPSPEQIEYMLKTYWTAIHPHWPVLYKPSFDAHSIFTVQDEVPRYLLFAMYALASRLSPIILHDTDTSTCASTMFFRVAKQEVLQHGLIIDLDTCTALFLLSLYCHGDGQQREAWVHCGLAAMMALDLGLHKKCPNLSEEEHERRVRIFCNIFVYEKILAAEMGRPVTLRTEHCDPSRMSEDQPDEYETAPHPHTGQAVRLHTLSVFNAAVDLFRIFDRILSEVHWVPMYDAGLVPASRTTRERLVDELDRHIEHWLTNLPPRCAYPRPDDRHPTRTRYLTHAWYLVAVILLHRPLIPRFRPGRPFQVNPHHTKATDAANNLVDLLLEYAQGHEIDKLPPNDAYLIFTSAIMHIFNLGSGNRILREAAKPRLQQCLDWLKGLAVTWPAASSHKRLLDAFSEAATNTISNLTPELHERKQNIYNPPGPQEEHYTSDQQLLHPYQPQTLPMPELESKFQPGQSTSGLYDLEAMYWNNFHPAGNGYQAPQWYPQTGEAQAMPGYGVVYNEYFRNFNEGHGHSGQ